MAFNILEIKPHVVSGSLEGKSFLIYGGVKTGKTTIASKFPNALLLAFEKGYNMIEGIRAQPIHSWSEAKQAKSQLLSHMRDFTSGKVDELVYKTVVVDTADLAWEQCVKFVLSAHGKADLTDIPFGKGHKQASQEYQDFFVELLKAGFTIVAISHSSTKNIKDAVTGEEIEYTLPSLEKRPFNILTGMADIVGHTERIPLEDGTYQTVLRLRGNRYTEAGSRNPYSSEFIPFTYDALMEDMEKAVQQMNDGTPPVEANPYKEAPKEDFKEVRKQIANWAKELQQKNQGERYQKLIYKYLGDGVGVKDCTEEQLDVLIIIRDDLKALIEELGIEAA